MGDISLIRKISLYFFTKKYEYIILHHILNEKFIIMKRVENKNFVLVRDNLLEHISVATQQFILRK